MCACILTLVGTTTKATYDPQHQLQNEESVCWRALVPSPTPQSAFPMGPEHHKRISWAVGQDYPALRFTLAGSRSGVDAWRWMEQIIHLSWGGEGKTSHLLLFNWCDHFLCVWNKALHILTVVYECLVIKTTSLSVTVHSRSAVWYDFCFFKEKWQWLQEKEGR